MKNYIADYFSQLQTVLSRIEPGEVEPLVRVLHEARLERRAVFLMGNGGSAATASHWAEDLCKGTAVPGVPGFRALGLTESVPGLTAWANDTGYDNIFAGQLENWLQPRDVVIAISGSGNSPNVLNGVRFARARGALTIGLTGFEGGRLKGMVDLPLVVPSHSMEQIEDVHLILSHSISTTLRRLAQQLAGQPETLTCAASPRARAVFLDRDGVINHNRADHVKSWEEFRFLDGSLEALARLAATDFKIVVVTNQSVIGRKLVTREVVEDIHRRMLEQIRQAGGRVDYVACCPHHPDENCECRKPRPGLVLEASRVLNLDLSRSYFIGDSFRDLEVSAAVGCTPVLVRTGVGQETLRRLDEQNGHRPAIVDDLADAVAWILECERGPADQLPPAS